MQDNRKFVKFIKYNKNFIDIKKTHFGPEKKQNKNTKAACTAAVLLNQYWGKWLRKKSL